MSNIDPRLWGNNGWKFIHYITLGYPDNPMDSDKENYKTYLEKHKFVLPCENCRMHYTKNIEKYPLNDHVMASRYNLFKWGVDMHNEVNIANGKKIMSVEEALILYSTPKQKSNKFEFNTQTINIILLIVLILLLVIYVKRI
jgi:hypothetical protein